MVGEALREGLFGREMMVGEVEFLGAVVGGGQAGDQIEHVEDGGVRVVVEGGGGVAAVGDEDGAVGERRGWGDVVVQMGGIVVDVGVFKGGEVGEVREGTFTSDVAEALHRRKVDFRFGISLMTAPRGRSAALMCLEGLARVATGVPHGCFGWSWIRRRFHVWNRIVQNLRFPGVDVFGPL